MVHQLSCVELWIGSVQESRYSRVDNIKMDLLEIGWGGVDWAGLAQDRDKWRAFVNVVMNLQVP
jgi:hypothetical protein